TYVRLNNSLRNITYPILYQDADFYVPAITSVPVIADLAGITMVWDANELSIRAAELQHNVLDLKFSPRSNGYLCEIILAHPLEYEVLVTEGSWINITLQGGNLNPGYISNRPHSSVIRKIRAFQFESSSQISINFRRDVNEMHHSLALNPPRIQISIIDTAFDYSAIDTIFSDDEFDPIDVIVIDAGHGGAEDGAIGPKGTLEKEIVLDIALRLEKLFEKDDVRVVLTRRDDTTLLLDERANLANSSGGEMFVSIHANWFEDGAAKGSQTFFLAAALNDAARATAMLENKSILLNEEGEITDTADELDLILFDLLQTEYLAESQALAREIQAEMIKNLRTRNRGVDQAGFFVLNKVYMPSVLVEVAFISNKHEEALLGKESFRQKAAEGIYAGIKNFIDKYSPDR
ncbi:MAG TPA: N-acetylmuramoyl-L-alanine amidase, partial [candidate division Zixibacteria bacterium]|nr:N-acetylmuramoyl-L-alanine amidase [candidate division Zixibacteria bacterium]